MIIGSLVLTAVLAVVYIALVLSRFRSTELDGRSIIETLKKETPPAPIPLRHAVRAPIEVRPEIPATAGVKLDAGKPPMDLLDGLALEEVGRVLDFGATKYAPDNWRKGISKGRLLAAAIRHIYASARGEKKDPESGLSHLAHAMCCLMFALHFELTKNEIGETRWKK